MASLEEAYSTEFGEVVDAERAYDLYWADVIEDKRAFCCPGEGCSVQVTCANIDKERQDMRQSPHFRQYGDHAAICDAVSLGSSLKSSTTLDHGHSNAKRTKEGGFDILRLRRPPSHFQKRSDQSSRPNAAQASKAAIDANKRSSRPGGCSEVFSIRPLVSKFVRHKRDSQASRQVIQIGAVKVTYADLFREVNNQKLLNLPKGNLVYWGTAFVDRTHAKNAYIVKFSKSLLHGEHGIRPTTIISDSALASYPVGKLVTARLKKIGEMDSPRCYAFVYGTPKARSSNGKIYLNIDVATLDFLEIRHLDLFEEP